MNRYRPERAKLTVCKRRGEKERKEGKLWTIVEDLHHRDLLNDLEIGDEDDVCGSQPDGEDFPVLLEELLHFGIIVARQEGDVSQDGETSRSRWQVLSLRIEVMIQSIVAYNEDEQE